MKKFDNIDSIVGFVALLEQSPEWENLQDKTQVFNERINHNVKSRGSHCGDVGDIASKLCKLLGADELTIEKARLIGIIHDLGHISYGHAGETVADSMIEQYDFSDEEIAQIMNVRKTLFGEEYVQRNETEKREGTNYTKNICFEHNENSVLQYVVMCKRFGYEIDEEVIIGILSHSTSRYKDLPMDLSQQAVRLADKLAYINYDVDDLLTSFKDKPEELAALNDLYQKPLLDPNGNEIKITLQDGKSYTIYEFLTQLSSADRIDSFIQASVIDAKNKAQNRPDKYNGYNTILTGCNDIIVEISDLRKSAKKAKTEEERNLCFEKIELLRTELYARSPILYAAYEIKERSDDFIRNGIGLSKESQIDRTKNSVSAVGNKDLMNEYIYKALVVYLKNQVKINSSLSREQIIDRYQKSGVPQEYIDLFLKYMEFKKEQDSVILSLPGNNGNTYPEIYTIISFIGIHSNTQLTTLAKIGGLVNRFEQEVLPQIQTLLNDPEMYDSEKGVFTKKGNKEREALVSKYGAQSKLEFGLEEENIVATASDDSIQRTIYNGYIVKDYVPNNNTMIKQQFDHAKAKAETEYIAKETLKLNIAKSENEINNEELGGKKI